MKTITVDSKDVKFMLHEVCFECLDAIKAHLQQLRWFQQYDEHEEERLRVGKLGNIFVVDIYLSEKGPLLIYSQHEKRRRETLVSMLIDDQITGDQLSEILESLEKIGAPKTEN